MSRGVSVQYGDIAPEAKENFVVNASESLFGDIYKEQLQRYNMPLLNYANPCEWWQTLLDGSAEALPYSDTANIALWSEQLSDNAGAFAQPITLTLESEGQYSSTGFTFAFDKHNNIYPTDITIQWYRDEEELDTKEFHPTTGFYFCYNKVENFNRVCIAFEHLNMPHNRLKIESIDYGYGTVFYGNELRTVKITQALEPISSEITINTCDFTVDSRSDIEYSFQSKQSAIVRFNGELMATTFVKGANRLSRRVWEVTSEDYIGIMDSVPYVGGMYDNIEAGAILDDIFTTAKVPYSVDDAISSFPLTGYIPYTTCREALMQVCFASCATVNTANSDKVNVIKLSDDIRQTIPLRRIMQGQNFEHGETVTSVELTAHHYHVISPTMEAYKAEDSGIGENILVKFSEPLFQLDIVNGTFVQDDEGNDKKGVNYAYINADEGCILSGRKYDHTQRIYKRHNPLVLATDKENVTTVTNATLVSASNAEQVLNNAYKWLTKRDTTNMSIVVGKDIVREARPIRWGEEKWGNFKWGDTVVTEQVTPHQDVLLGECITTNTEYMGDVTGRVISQTYNLNGNIIVKEVVVR